MQDSIKATKCRLERRKKGGMVNVGDICATRVRLRMRRYHIAIAELTFSFSIFSYRSTGEAPDYSLRQLRALFLSIDLFSAWLASSCVLKVPAI